MSVFLEAQPQEHRGPLADALRGEAVNMAILLHLDFVNDPLFLSNRTVPFVDQKWGYTWQAGADLLVSLPDFPSEQNNLAPVREYQVFAKPDLLEDDDWRVKLLNYVGDVDKYRGRGANLYGQIFDGENGQPVGIPFALDASVMDRLKLSMSLDSVSLLLQSESLLARKGTAGYGALTYLDQKRRYPGDEGLQFVAEAERLIEWTNW